MTGGASLDLSGISAQRSSLILMPFLTSTILIAAAHAGSASSNSAPSASWTSSTSLRQSRRAGPRGSALTSKPSLLFSDIVEYLLATPSPSHKGRARADLQLDRSY